jgi:hypothetical protein
LTIADLIRIVSKFPPSPRNRPEIRAPRPRRKFHQNTRISSFARPEKRAYNHKCHKDKDEEDMAHRIAPPRKSRARQRRILANERNAQWLQKAFRVFTPLLDNGQAVGLNDAGIQTFNVWDFVAELSQNTRDAISDQMVKKGGPATIRFRRVRLPAGQIPGLDTIVGNFENCMDCFSKDEATVSHFERAIQAISGSAVDCLLVSDFGTTGLNGDDYNPLDPWFAAARARGITNKPGPGAGGSYGIGKASALGASLARFVIFYTLTEDGERKALGSVSATSFTDEDPSPTNGRHKYQSHWFVGGEKGEAVTDRRLIPEILAEREEPGLDVLVVGFDFGEGDGWTGEIAARFCRKFWPATHNGAIRCEIHDEDREVLSVHKANIEAQLKQRDPEALLHYEAYTRGKREEHSTGALGKSTTYVLETPGGNSKFAMIRGNGMVIETKTRSSEAPYAAVFECLDPKGGEILRKMEPPRHDKWDPDRHPKGREARGEINEIIRKAVERLGDNNQRLESLAGLERLLPMDKAEAERAKFPPPIKPKSEKAGKKKRGGERDSKYIHLHVPALAVRAEDGEYELVVNREEEETVLLAIRLATDSADEPDNMRLSSARLGDEPLPIGEDHTIGPFPIGKGRSTLKLETADKGRFSLKVFQLVPKKKESE